MVRIWTGHVRSNVLVFLWPIDLPEWKVLWRLQLETNDKMPSIRQKATTTCNTKSNKSLNAALKIRFKVFDFVINKCPKQYSDENKSMTFIVAGDFRLTEYFMPMYHGKKETTDQKWRRVRNTYHTKKKKNKMKGMGVHASSHRPILLLTSISLSLSFVRFVFFFFVLTKKAFTLKQQQATAAASTTTSTSRRTAN